MADSLLQHVTPISHAIELGQETVEPAVVAEPKRITPERLADVVDASDTVGHIQDQRHRSIAARLLSKAIPGAAIGGFGLGLKGGLWSQRPGETNDERNSSVRRWMGLGAAAGGATGLGVGLGELLTESSRLKRAKGVLSRAPQSVKQQLRDPEVEDQARSYQGARELPLRLSELGILAGGVGGSALGAINTPWNPASGTVRVPFVGGEIPSDKMKAIGKWGLIGSAGVGAAGLLTGLLMRQYKRRKLLQALQPKQAAENTMDNDKELGWPDTNAPKNPIATGGNPRKASNRNLLRGHAANLTRYSGGRFVSPQEKSAAQETPVSPEPSQKLRSRSEVVIYNDKGVLGIKKGTYLLMPGGGIDDGETPEFGAYREAIEEADRKLLHMKPMGCAEAIWPKDSRLVKGFDGERSYFHMALDGGKLGTEHDDNEAFKIIPFEDALKFLDGVLENPEQEWAKESNKIRKQCIEEAQQAAKAGNTTPVKLARARGSFDGAGVNTRDFKACQFGLQDMTKQVLSRPSTAVVTDPEQSEKERKSLATKMAEIMPKPVHSEDPKVPDDFTKGEIEQHDIAAEVKVTEPLHQESKAQSSDEAIQRTSESIAGLKEDSEKTAAAFVRAPFTNMAQVRLAIKALKPNPQRDIKTPLTVPALPGSVAPQPNWQRNIKTPLMVPALPESRTPPVAFPPGTTPPVALPPASTPPVAFPPTKTAAFFIKTAASMLTTKQSAELAGSPSEEAEPMMAVKPHEEPDHTDNTPAILVDLDGTVRGWQTGKEFNQLGSQFILPNRKETLGPLKQMGFRVIGVTNHSCHKGRDDHEGLTPDLLHELQHETLGMMDGVLDDVCYCPTPHPDVLKPAPTMIQFAMKRYGVDPSKCIMVGDNPSHDGGAAEAAGIPFSHADQFFADPQSTVSSIQKLLEGGADDSSAKTAEFAEPSLLQPFGGERRSMEPADLTVDEDDDGDEEDEGGEEEGELEEEKATEPRLAINLKKADAINVIPRSEYMMFDPEDRVYAAPDQNKRFKFPTQGEGKKAPYEPVHRFVPPDGVPEAGIHGYDINLNVGDIDPSKAPQFQGGQWLNPDDVLKSLYGSMGKKENLPYREIDRARARVILNHLKRKRKAKALAAPAPITAPVVAPVMTQKLSADWGQLGRDIIGQLPRVRLPDSVVGGALGAAGGLAYHAMSNREDSDPTKPRHKGIEWGNLLKRVGIGAGIGAAAGNVVGDRSRRYISNNISPYGYGVRDKIQDLKPKSLSQVWRTAIQDKPVEGFGVDKRTGKDDRPEETTMRRELLRRGLGVHTVNPKEDVFEPAPDGTLHINPAYTAKTVNTPGSWENTHIKNPLSKDSRFLEARLLGSYGHDAIKNPSAARIRDTWDFDLHDTENSWLKNQVGQAAHHPVDFARKTVDTLKHTPADGKISDYFSEGTGTSQWDDLKSMAARKLMNDVVIHHPAKFDATYPVAPQNFTDPDIDQDFANKFGNPPTSPVAKQQ